MAKQITSLTDIIKNEEILVKGCQYYREGEINGRWRLFDPLEEMLLAYSMIHQDKEMVVIINLNCNKEISTRITVDRNLSSSGSKFKDIAGRHKIYAIEEESGRNFVSVKLKPNTFAVLKKVS
jgi:hypothetical protein